MDSLYGICRCDYARWVHSYAAAFADGVRDQAEIERERHDERCVGGGVGTQERASRLVGHTRHGCFSLSGRFGIKILEMMPPNHALQRL